MYEQTLIVDFPAIDPPLPQVERASRWRLVLHAVMQFLFARHRGATAEEVAMQRAHSREARALQVQLNSALATVEDREQDIRHLKDELAAAESKVKILELETLLLAKVDERNRTRVEAETAIAASRKAHAEMGRVPPK